MAEQIVGPDGLPSVRGTGGTGGTGRTGRTGGTVRRRTARHVPLQGRPHRARTRTALVAAGLAVLGALGPTPSSALSPAAEGPRPGDPARFVPGPCPETPEPIPGRCGFLEVPENRTRKKTRTIKTAVVIIPATSAKPAADPVVFMEGGPGGDAIGAIPFLIASHVNRDRDLIVMTQRGALYSQPNLACPEMDRFNATAVGLPYDAPSTGRGLVRAAKECRDRLTAEGIDLTAYNTTENAADFAALRKALGIKKWNVYGYSYGTDLGLTYLRRHPQGIRSLAIDSVVPPQTVSLPWAWDSAQEGINAIFAACEAQPACDARYPDLSRTLTEQVRRLEANPLTLTVPPPGGGTPVKVVLDGGTLVNLLVTNGRLVPAADVPAALHELADGNPERLARAQAAGATPVIGEFAHGLTHSVACAEWAPGFSKRDVLNAGRRAFPGWPDSVLAHAPQLPFEHDLCRAWNVPDRTAVQRVATHSKVPALIITGTFDAKTGASWGPFAGRTLPRSTAVVIPGITHWVVPQEPCAASVLLSFLARPTAPDTGCVAGVVPKPFTIIP